MRCVANQGRLAPDLFDDSLTAYHRALRFAVDHPSRLPKGRHSSGCKLSVLPLRESVRVLHTGSADPVCRFRVRRISGCRCLAVTRCHQIVRIIGRRSIDARIHIRVEWNSSGLK